jgi:hypothetical protein
MSLLESRRIRGGEEEAAAGGGGGAGLGRRGLIRWKRQRNGREESVTERHWRRRKREGEGETIAWPRV